MLKYLITQIKLLLVTVSFLFISSCSNKSEITNGKSWNDTKSDEKVINTQFSKSGLYNMYVPPPGEKKRLGVDVIHSKPNSVVQLIFQNKPYTLGETNNIGSFRVQKERLLPGDYELKIIDIK